MFDEVSSVLADCLQSVSECDELKALLQYHKDPNQLDHNGNPIYQCSCIRSGSRCFSIVLLSLGPLRTPQLLISGVFCHL